MIRNILQITLSSNRTYLNSSLRANKLYTFSTKQQPNENVEKENQNTDKEQNEEQAKRKQKQEEARQRVQKEAAIRQQMKEEKEINELKNEYEQQNIRFSTFSQFFRLMRSRLILGGLGLLSIGLGYQLYEVTEKHVDPVNGNKKILPIKKKYGKLTI